jgi:hypothetical protein
VNLIDPFGQWSCAEPGNWQHLASPNVHRPHMHKSLRDASEPAGVTSERFEDEKGISWYVNCFDLIYDRLKSANCSQDEGEAFDDLKRHFNKTIHGRKKPQVAINKFKQYVQEELYNYNTILDGVVSLAPCVNEKKSKCEAALDALGRVTHTWQDFYCHAMLKKGNDEIWNPVYLSTKDHTGVKDSPDNIVNVIPSTSPRGEWGKADFILYRFTSHGWREPYGPEKDARLQAMDEYVTSQYIKLLPKWVTACKCCCPIER